VTNVCIVYVNDIWSVSITHRKGKAQKEGMCHSICAAAISAQTRRVAQTFEYVAWRKPRKCLSAGRCPGWDSSMQRGGNNYTVEIRFALVSAGPAMGSFEHCNKTCFHKRRVTPWSPEFLIFSRRLLTTDCVPTMLAIRLTRGSNLHPERDYTDWSSSLFSSVCPSNCRDCNVNQSTTASFYIPSTT
jgi:hypothetical protein